jgi:hypothetical protein
MARRKASLSFKLASGHLISDQLMRGQFMPGARLRRIYGIYRRDAGSRKIVADEFVRLGIALLKL